MSKKSAQSRSYTIHPFLLALIFVQCAVTIFVVLRQQTQIQHAALLERIQTLKTSHPQVYCPEEKTDVKLPIDK